MRTTLNLRDDLVKEAKEITNIKSKTELIHEGLKALIEKHSAKRLKDLGGSEKQLKDIPRRR